VYVYVDGGGCQVAFDGRLPTVAKEAVGKGGFTVECGGTSICADAALAESSGSVTCYKCKANFDLAIAAQGPNNLTPSGEECVCVKCITPPKRARAQDTRISCRATPTVE